MQVKELCDRARSKGLALTCDDVTLADQPSNVHPNEVQLKGQVGKYALPLPILSAAMDTVTEAQLALAMAQQGGLGILHRNLAPEEQAKQVAWVRRQVHLGGSIAQPVCFQASDRLSKLEACQQFSSFPILDGERLVGLITRNELAFATENPLLSEIMRPLDKLVHARVPCSSDQAHKLMVEHRVKRLPLCDDQGTFRGLFVWRDLSKYKDERVRYALDEDGHFLVGAAVSPQPSDWPRIELLAQVGCKIIVIDSSHGACDQVRQQMIRIRKAYPEIQLIVGNIASHESAKYLLESEVLPDALKVGVGPGSICTTRQVTGHGVPQLTAISEVKQAIRESGQPVSLIADGGIRSAGDAVKCLAFGADAVMLGSMLAGCDESCSERVGERKRIRGMASESALAAHSGSRSRYQQTAGQAERLASSQQNKLTPEGVEGWVKACGPVSAVLARMAGGVRSGLAHSGSKSLAEFKPLVWRQSPAGLLEGRTHSITQ